MPVAHKIKNHGVTIGNWRITFNNFDRIRLYKDPEYSKGREWRNHGWYHRCISVENHMWRGISQFLNQKRYSRNPREIKCQYCNEPIPDNLLMISELMSM